MANFNIEINLNDAHVILNAFHQAFIRAEEICERQLAEENVLVTHIETLIHRMNTIHTSAKKVGEQIKKQPYVNAEAVDSFVSIDGTWEKRIQAIKNKLARIDERKFPSM